MGTLRSVGHKHGEWRDTVLMQRALGDGDATPPAGREPARDAAGQLPVAAPVRPPVGARAIVCLGLSQLIGWGVTFYLIGALGPAITAGLGWNSAAVYGGFSAAIVTMALVSPIAGLAVDRWAAAA